MKSPSRAEPPSDPAPDPAQWGVATDAGRVPFVSRSAPAARRGPTPVFDSRGGALPTLRDPWVLALLLLVLVLQAIAWWRIEGYQIADSVEFMERARIFVRGEQMVDAGAIRPFGFSSVLVPFFVIADWFGLPDQRAVVWCMTMLEMGIGLALVLVVVRIGAQLVDRNTGLIAGFVVGTNPVFLQYSAQPVSGIAAGLCVALAIESLLVRGNFRRAFIGGLWLAAAMLMHYQCIPIVIAVALVVALRDRLRHPHSVAAIMLAVALGCLLQVTLDKLMYDSFGASLWSYTVLNFGSVLTSFFLKLKWLDAALYFYNIQQAVLAGGYNAPETFEVQGLQAPWYYVQNLPQMLVWPAIAMCALGFLRGFTRTRWTATMLLVALVANVVAQSNKGSKDFRLWLPLLPFLGPLCGYGWSWIAQRSDGGARPWRFVLSVAVVAATLFFSFRNLFALHTRQFGGYWESIDFVNQHVLESYPERAAVPRLASNNFPPPKLRVGSAYNWAVYMRESALVELIKLPSQLNLWAKYDEAVRGNDLATIEDLDILITHLPILDNNLDLIEWVNAHFEVCGAFYDQLTYEAGLGPILVLQKRRGERDARLLYDLHTDVSAETFRRRRQLTPATHFVRVPSGVDENRLVFLGCEYRDVPPQHHGWLTYHWYTPTGLERDYEFIDRITSPDEHNCWQNNHDPAHGVFPTSTWPKGAIVSESYLLVAADEPYRPRAPFRPLGGGYRRGDMIPVRLWMGVVEHPPAARDGVAQEPAEMAVAAACPLEGWQPQPGAEFEATREELEISAEGGLVRVGAFFLPVAPLARVVDDGRPIPK